MTTYALNTTITMRENRRMGTKLPPVITATVVSKRRNAFGGMSYMLKFELPIKMNGNPVTTYRSLTDYELAQREATVVKKARKLAIDTTILGKTG